MRNASIVLGEVFVLLAITMGCATHQPRAQCSSLSTSQPTSACASQPGKIVFQAGPDTLWWKETILCEYVEFKDIGELKSVRGTQVKLIERDARKKTAAFELTYRDKQQILVGKEGGALKDKATGNEYCWRLGSVSSKRTVLKAVYFEHETNFDSYQPNLILLRPEVDEPNLGAATPSAGTQPTP